MLVEKILVANRGEIACRIIRTIRKMGYTSVAVFSDVDQNALHVQLADEAIYIGPSKPSLSYLSIDNIINAAKKIRADAIHPGYGFLSENADFAQRCFKEQLIFIGPSAEAIRLMSSKSASKTAMIQANITCIPGYHGTNQDDDTFIFEAEKIGFPVMIKACAGSGGRGIRRVEQPEHLRQALVGARSEAQKSFGHADLILEKVIQNARHIEVPILADSFGHCIHLGERDCSLQRQYQQVIEESPSPVNRASLREKMGLVAVKIAQSCHYIGAGTVEFLVNDTLDFYFLEMNTRIQIEHRLTELVTSVDLIEQQIRIATGKPLQLKQSDIHLRGHAIEARLYAEDPSSNYTPQAGPIHHWIAPKGEGIHCETGIIQGQVVSPYYNPVLAKIIGYGATRAIALRHLTTALRTTTLCGIKTNRDFLIRLLDADYVREGQFDTSTLSSTDVLADLLETENDIEQLTIAAVIDATKSIRSMHMVTTSLLPPYLQTLRLNNTDFDISIEFWPNALECLECHIVITTNMYQQAPQTVSRQKVQLWSINDGVAQITFESIRTHYHYYVDQHQIWLSNRQFCTVVEHALPHRANQHTRHQQVHNHEMVPS